MIKIHAIGNSFSRDATRYLKGTANTAGMAVQVENLYVGGYNLNTTQACGKYVGKLYFVKLHTGVTGTLLKEIEYENPFAFHCHTCLQ